MRARALVGWVWLTSCSVGPAGPPAPAPAAPAASAASAPAAPSPSAKTESTEARRERLFREADLRAGLDPDRGLTPWHSEPGLRDDERARAAASASPCVAGQAGLLRLDLSDGPGGAPIDLAHAVALAGPARVELKGGRHAGEPAVSLSRLAPGVVALSTCNGERVTLDPTQLAEPDRLVLVRNQRDQLKLVDRLDDQGGRAPLVKDVTVLHGR